MEKDEAEWRRMVEETPAEKREEEEEKEEEGKDLEKTANEEEEV